MNPRFLGLSLLIAFLASASFAGSARAQDDIPLGRFGVQRFAPAPGPGNYLQTEGGRVFGDPAPGVGLTFDYSHRPFVLFDATCDSDGQNCEIGDINTALSAWMLQANLYGSIVLFDRFQIGVNLPLLVNSGETFADTVQGQPVQIAGGTSFALGDPTLSLKARIIGDGTQGFFLAASAFATFPVGHAMNEDGFFGDESFRFGGNLIAEIVAGGFHLALNAGGFWRPEQVLFSTRAASQITYRAAIGYDITPLVMLFAEFDGASQISDEVDEHPLEGRLAGRIRFGDFNATIFGGAGILSGVGVPLFRAGLGFAYQPERLDSDGDGVEDEEDACPSEPEDEDGWQDEDGCPETDNDGDGLDDDVDPCPAEAEDMDEFEDEDGCPDPDNDNDGVTDGFDSCPNDPEDMDGDRDDDGCPDNDTDQDGIPDHEDQCPNEMEDADGFGDEDGCPEDDFDGDGVPDDGDECPEEAETANGIQDTDGCPEPDGDGDGIVDAADSCANRAETYNGRQDDDGCPDGAALASLSEGQIQIHAPIRFRPDRPAFRRGNSALIVQAVGNLMMRNPGVRTTVEVHAHPSGDSARDEATTRDRAVVIRDLLIRLGVDGERLAIRPFGSASPVAEGAGGEEANNRVLFAPME